MLNRLFVYSLTKKSGFQTFFKQLNKSPNNQQFENL